MVFYSFRFFVDCHFASIIVYFFVFFSQSETQREKSNEPHRLLRFVHGLIKKILYIPKKITNLMWAVLPGAEIVCVSLVRDI